MKVFCTSCNKEIKGKPKGTIATPYCEECFKKLFRTEKRFWKIHSNIVPIEMAKDPLEKWYTVIALSIVLLFFAGGWFVGYITSNHAIEKLYDTCNTACIEQGHSGVESWHFNSACECTDGEVISMPPVFMVKTTKHK